MYFFTPPHQSPLTHFPRIRTTHPPDNRLTGLPPAAAAAVSRILPTINMTVLLNQIDADDQHTVLLNQIDADNHAIVTRLYAISNWTTTAATSSMMCSSLVDSSLDLLFVVRKRGHVHSPPWQTSIPPTIFGEAKQSRARYVVQTQLGVPRNERTQEVHATCRFRD